MITPHVLFSKPHIFVARWRKPLIFQTLTIGYNITHSLKYQKSITSGCNDIEIVYMLQPNIYSR